MVGFTLRAPFVLTWFKNNLICKLLIFFAGVIYIMIEPFQSSLFYLEDFEAVLKGANATLISVICFMNILSIYDI